MASVTGQAQSAVNSVFNPAVGQINAQVPAIQNLYQTLVAGLQNQGQSQLQNVLTSADQRGVMRGTTAANTQGALDQTLMQALAPMNVQRAKDKAGILGQVGKANVGRAQAVASTADTIQTGNINKATNQLAMEDMQNDAKIRKINYDQAQAEAAARAAQSAAREAALTVDQRLDMQEGGWSPGKDGYVSPRAWNSAIQDWIDAGGTAASFTKRFGHLANKDLYQQKSAFKDSKGKSLRYKGVSVKGD